MAVVKHIGKSLIYRANNTAAVLLLSTVSVAAINITNKPIFHYYRRGWKTVKQAIQINASLNQIPSTHTLSKEQLCSFGSHTAATATIADAAAISVFQLGQLMCVLIE